MTSRNAYLEVTADSLYDTYDGRVTDAAGRTLYRLDAAEAAFLYWLSDLGIVTDEMGPGLFGCQGSALIGPARLTARLLAIGIDPDSLFTRRSGAYQATAPAKPIIDDLLEREATAVAYEVGLTTVRAQNILAA